MLTFGSETVFYKDRILLFSRSRTYSKITLNLKQFYLVAFVALYDKTPFIERSNYIRIWTLLSISFSRSFFEAWLGLCMGRGCYLGGYLGENFKSRSKFKSYLPMQ